MKHLVFASFWASLFVSGATFAQVPASPATDDAPVTEESIAAGMDIRELSVQTVPDRVEHTRTEDGIVNDCEWFTSKKPYAVCITRAEGSRSKDLLWYMHGASGNEKKWVNHFGPIRDAWRRIGYEIPTTISLSFGPIWLMAEKNGKGTAGLWEFIMDKLMPYYENKIFGGPVPGRRLVMGESMGGYNTAQMAMKRPELFARAAILCPAITFFGPYSPKKELDAFLKAHDEASWLAVYWESIMERVFYTKEAWPVNGDSLAIGKRHLGPQTPPLYLSCGEQDEFGFHEGAEAFAELARAQGVNVTWETMPGKHCVYDGDAVGRFLAGN